MLLLTLQNLGAQFKSGNAAPDNQRQIHALVIKSLLTD
jgi:hypothetical protein